MCTNKVDGLVESFGKFARSKPSKNRFNLNLKPTLSEENIDQSSEDQVPGDIGSDAK